MPEQLKWPSASQVCRLVCQTKRNGKWQVQVHYKITSLTPAPAGAKDLLELSRTHWGIENRVHYVRDVTLAEDASRIRKGNAPQAMAAVRNLVLNVLRQAGVKNIAAGVRHFSWQMNRAAAALGLSSQSLASTGCESGGIAAVDLRGWDWRSS